VNIQSSAHVHGDVFHDTLSIDAGAIIEGSLKQRFEKEEPELISEDLKPAKEVKTLLDDADSDLSFVNKQAADKAKSN
jgi:cytoskeletal protein CcmA (bactofilin family)